MIELIDVSKQYATKLAVDRLTLTVQPGELFAFLGPNGAGKTTTIKMLCGLLFPTSGAIRIGGYDMKNEPRIEEVLEKKDTAKHPFSPK